MANRSRTARLRCVLIPCMFLSSAWGQELSFLRAISNANSLETVAAVAADANAAYVSGMMWPNRNYDYYSDGFVRKFDLAGSPLWERTFGGPVSLSGIAEADGGIYVAGYTAWNLAAQVYFVLPGQTGNGFADAFIRRYDRDGNEVWTRQFGTAAPDAVYGLAVDSTGVYVLGNFGTFLGAGQTFLRKFDFNGTELWTQKLPGGYAVAVGGPGVYVTGSSYEASTSDWSSFVSRYDREGNSIWTQPIEFRASVLSASADDMGVSIAGASIDTGDSFVRKYDQQGNVLWTNRLPTHSINGLAHENSVLYVGGTISQALPGQC